MSFHLFLKITNSEKHTVFYTLFRGITDEKTHEKVQRKEMNFTELELLQILILLNRKPGFYNAFAKIYIIKK